MSFAIRIAIVLVLIVLVEMYFYQKVINSFKRTFKNVSNRKVGATAKILFIYFNLFIIFLLGLLLYTLISGSPYPRIPENPFFNYLIEYPFWFFVLLTIQSILFLLIFELFKLIIYPLYKKHKEKLKRYEAMYVLIIVGFFILYIPARVIFDYNTISISPYEYKSENLPEQLNNFRITFISDIHADEYTDSKRLEKFIGKVNKTKPDLVLIGGDMISSGPEYIDTAAVYLGKIKSKYGMYSCVGDHDFWAYRNDYNRSLREITAALKQHGITMIDNADTVVKVDSTNIDISFVTNTYVRKTPDYVVDSLSKELNPKNLKILVTHQPSMKTIQEAEKDGYNLLLAGHTHGGQITFLFPFKNLSPTMIETPLLRGEFHFGSMMMIVTRGLGMSIVPMRYNSTPEVSAIVLEKE